MTPNHNMQSTQCSNALGLVDLNRFPLCEPHSEIYKRRVVEAQEGLARDGCCVLRGLVRADALLKVAAETGALAPVAHFTSSCATVYGQRSDETQPDDHPLRVEVRRDNGFVAGDHIDGSAWIRQLYHEPAFRNFIGACTGCDEIYEFADPLAQLVVNVLHPGAGHGWHFDSNEFVVTLLTQPPKAGGRFEYCPQIRSPQQENYDDVGDVLAGGTDHVRRLDLRAGDLQIFFGRYSLHRVSVVEGNLDRHTVIFAYAREPDMYGNPEKTRQIFGRMTDDHTMAGKVARSDGLVG